MIRFLSIAFFAFSILLLSSCASPKVGFTYLESAQIDIPTYIKSLVVVDHSAPKNGTWDILEGGLTGENIGQDREGVLNLIAGVKEIGLQSNRYSLSKESKRYGKGKLFENIPEPMAITLIKSIGRKHGADAVLAIDKFDSDFITTNRRLEDEDPEEEGGKPIPQYKVTGVATITAYIRMYEVKTGNILDEIKHSYTYSYHATAKTVAQALLLLIQKQKAVNSVSYEAGIKYGKRVAPSEVYVKRSFYKRPTKKNPAFDRGVRNAEVGDWKKAINDFEMASKGRDLKIAGRAAYNLAICYEVLGELKTAEKWAQKSYVTFGFKKGVDYQRLLSRRITDSNRLQQQLKE